MADYEDFETIDEPDEDVIEEETDEEDIESEDEEKDEEKIEEPKKFEIVSKKHTELTGPNVITPDVISANELARLLALRTSQLEKGPSTITGNEKLSPYEKAQMELDQGCIPLYIKRYIGTTTYEVRDPNFMSKGCYK